jgi:GH15 family glucan-1,4-alpha-glucosidase
MGAEATRQEAAPSIAGYGLIGDCHGAALVSTSASIDWCCLPRFDSASLFARLLDPERGGSCSLRLEGGGAMQGASAYVDDTLVLETTVQAAGGTVRVLDFFAMPEQGAVHSEHQLVRVLECVRGRADVELSIAPRFDYGAIRPWLRRHGVESFTAVGGSDALLIWSDHAMEIDGERLAIAGPLHAGERMRLTMRYLEPHRLEHDELATPTAPEVDAALERTVAWWREWRSGLRTGEGDPGGLVRSALTLKALSFAPSGAIVAAATTSLPETPGGERNWDYRFSWIRDSTFSAHALAELGATEEARRFRHFIVRSSAGHAEDLQILYGIGGERRLPEQQLDLAGYRGSRPVRFGNGAASQSQLDAFGELLNLGWRWHMRGHSPDDYEWRFFAELVETAVARWREPDRGIWEWRGDPLHFVHSKAGCWAAVQRGLDLAEQCMRKAPLRRWRRARDEIRAAIEAHGYDRRRGVFTRAFGQPAMDGALLLLPATGFIDYADERMARTADAVREELEQDGFLRRYRAGDGLEGEEGAFLPCSFWLAECYARGGRHEQAREVFERALAAAGPLGLFSEEVDPRTGELLGNYPQALTHLSHISAAIALAEAGDAGEPDPLAQAR